MIQLSKKLQNLREKLSKYLANIGFASRRSVEKLINSLISKYKTNFKGVGQPLRIALTGSRFGPGIYDILTSLGKVQVIERLKNI